MAATSAKGLAVVTGGAAGLGLSFGRALLAGGYSVGLLDLSATPPPEVADLIARNGNCHYLHADATNKKAMSDCIDHLVQAVGPLKVFVNNAGVGDEGNVERAIAINLTAVINNTNLAVRRMSGREGGAGGVVVNVASMGGLVVMPFSPVYAGTKAGVIHFSRSIAQAHAKSLESPAPVRIHALCPGFADTKLVSDMTALGGVFRKAVEQQGPLLSPEKVATGLMELIENKETGQVMRITNQVGIDYAKMGGGFNKEKAKL